MGDEVSKPFFTQQDHHAFSARLDQEMEFVRQLFKQQCFDKTSRKIGYELEVCLLDEQGSPAPVNQSILQSADNPLFTYELARFNLEINGNAFDCSSGVFQSLSDDLDTLYAELNHRCKQFGAQPGLFGVLPNLTLQQLDFETSVSEMYRYQMLNQCLIGMRGCPVHLEINGEDHLSIDKNDLMLEALGTSLQVHYLFPFEESVDSYHAGLWSSLAMLGIAANSPLVLQHRGWEESRIAIFKQAVDTRNAQEIKDGIIPRVHLSKGYIDSWLELFEDNAYYSAILPEVKQSPVEDLHHFNLHNGTIWRWVRPILGKIDDHYHLRLELRVIPSGPTRIDTLANLVFQIALLEGLKQTPEQLTKVPYAVLERDFYEAARHGLAAEVHWCNGETGRLDQLMIDYALPVARKGLKRFGQSLFAEHCMELIEQRIGNRQTGAQWIRDHWLQHQDADRLVRDYQHHARENRPVHSWQPAS